MSLNLKEDVLKATNSKSDILNPEGSGIKSWESYYENINHKLFDNIKKRYCSVDERINKLNNQIRTYLNLYAKETNKMTRCHFVKAIQIRQSTIDEILIEKRLLAELIIEYTGCKTWEVDEIVKGE